MVFTKLISRLSGKKCDVVNLEVLCQCFSADGERVLTISKFNEADDKESNIYGINITSAKNAHNDKCVLYDLMLLSYNDLADIKKRLQDYKNIISPVIYQCTCKSEVLRLDKFEDEDSICFDIFDNYFYKYKQKHKFFDNIEISGSDIPKFVEELLI